MSDEWNSGINRSGSEKDPASLGPAVVNPDRRNSHVEDTLSFSFPTGTKPEKKHTRSVSGDTLHIPPAVLPNGETVSGSRSGRSTGTLNIPPAVFPDSVSGTSSDTSSKPISFSDDFTAELRKNSRKNDSSSTHTLRTDFTSPFGPAGYRSSKTVREGGSGTTPTSTLKIPEARIDHTSVYHSFGYDAEEIPEDTTRLHNERKEHISREDTELLSQSLSENEQEVRVLPSRSEKNRQIHEAATRAETRTENSDGTTVIPFPSSESEAAGETTIIPFPAVDSGTGGLTAKPDKSVSEPAAAIRKEPEPAPKPRPVKKPAEKPSVSVMESQNKAPASGDTMVIPTDGKPIPEKKAEPKPAEKKPVSESRKPTVRKPVQTGGGNNTPPASEKPQKKQKKTSGWFIFLTALVVFAVLVELVVGAVGVSILSKIIKDSPNLSLTDFVGEESSKIYDDSGTLVTEVGVYLRENITYDKCPESLVDAFLSVEDSRFFSHFGFDVPRFTKAAIDNLKTRSFGQGGSTFTMQLVKNTYFSIDSMDASNTGTERTKSIEYKVQQIYLAIKLETLLSKKEIFQLYLNKLNFGGNIRGVQRASQYYFGKNCNELTLSESAMLAGIVNLPNRYNPYEYLDYGTARRNQVLDLMNYHGYINDEELNLAKAVRVENTLVGDHRKAVEDSQYQSYLDAVLEEAMALTGCDPTVKGMKIYTHLNRQMQDTVEAIQNGETNVIYPDELMQVAMISMNNRNGAIIAIGGGRNYDGARLLNRATMNYKQPGSSVKPLLSYGLAFEYLGYTIDELLLDKPITYPMESMVLVNANGHYNGDVTIKDAVGNSLNIPAIITLERVVKQIGREKVVDYLQKIGFSRVTNDSFNYSYAIGGTSFETTCKELAGAHSMLINGGIYNQPHTIQKIVMSLDGSEYYPTNTNVRALSSGSAYLSTQLEENNVSGPYFNWMQILKRDYPVYAKTGTTDWGRDGMQYGIPEGQMKDKWMVASSSQYTNCVWVGYDMAVAGKETYYTSYKSNLNIPGNINKILLDKEEELYGVPGAIEQPSDVEEVTYIYGTFPHVRPEYTRDGGGTITSLASKAGIESMPLVTTQEFYDYAKEESKLIGTSGMGAKYDQFNNLTVSFGNAISTCADGQKDISLHDQWNNITMWGACLADVSWLNTGESGRGFWGTVYCDDVPVGEFSSDTGYFSGWVADLYGTVKVCGGPSGVDGAQSACTVAIYSEDSNPHGYYDESGNWIQLEDYSEYGHWDDQGNWIGEGWWDENGFHH